MRALLVCGLGPGFKNADYLDGTLFDPADARVERWLAAAGMPDLALSQLSFDHGGVRYPLLRPRRQSVPHLTTFTLRSILLRAGVEFEILRTEAIWDRSARAPRQDADVVLLSTTFIWDRRTLERVLAWLAENVPGPPVVVGGQFANLKFAEILRDHPQVACVVRGDGEVALPAVLDTLSRGRSVHGIPNVVVRDRPDGRPTVAPLEMIDLDHHPSPSFPAERLPVVPYESMRGCPYGCRFCSFPAASPTWRYKSAKKIDADFRRYAEENGARFIKAMDSTFTVPRSRIRELVRLLRGAGIEWEGYSRANAVRTPGYLEDLAAAGCRFLSFGFESMSSRTLSAMDKRVTVEDSRRAFELLRDGPVGYRCSFMVGYPGETPADYEHTHRFLVDEYVGHFMLSVFSFSDEQMPVWQDARRFGLTITDPDDPDYSWRHDGMDVSEARALNHGTLDEVRRANDRAVLMLWQADYQHWLMPHRSTETNLRVEKAVERLGMLPRDEPDPRRGGLRARQILDELATLGVDRVQSAQITGRSLLEV